MYDDGSGDGESLTIHMSCLEGRRGGVMIGNKKTRFGAKAVFRCATAEDLFVLRLVGLARRTTPGVVGIVCYEGALVE